MMNASAAHKYYLVFNIYCVQLSSINNLFIVIYSYYFNLINRMKYIFFITEYIMRTYSG
jgi:hypothetical protein